MAATPHEPDLPAGRFAPCLVLLACSAGCVPWDAPGASLDACRSGQAGPVTVYSVAPPLGAAWWYVGPLPGGDGEEMVATGPEPPNEEPPFDGFPPAAPPIADPAESDTTEADDPNADTGEAGSDGKDPETGAPEPPNPNGGDASSTQSLRLLDFTGANGCFTCDITCTTKVPGPGQPHALSMASGASTISQSAACADAERHLKRFASTSYSLELEACGIVPTSASPAPLGPQ